MPIQPRDEITPYKIQKGVLMEALVNTDMGINFLQWLCNMCSWDQPIYSNEQAAQRDIWLALRRYIPAIKLPLIENQNIIRQQENLRAVLEVDFTENEDA